MDWGRRHFISVLILRSHLLFLVEKVKKHSFISDFQINLQNFSLGD